MPSSILGNMLGVCILAGWLTSGCRVTSGLAAGCWPAGRLLTGGAPGFGCCLAAGWLAVMAVWGDAWLVAGGWMWLAGAAAGWCGGGLEAGMCGPGPAQVGVE